MGVVEPIYIEHWDDIPIDISSKILYLWIGWGQKFINEPSGRCRCNPLSSMDIWFNENGWVVLRRVKIVSLASVNFSVF